MSVANNINLIGRLVRDPYVRESNNGTKIILATLAIDRDYKDKNGNTLTDFINIKGYVRPEVDGLGPWGYTSKGMLLAVTAALHSNRWTDNEGETHYNQEVIVDGLKFLEGKKTAEARTKNKAGMTVSQYNEHKATAPAPTEESVPQVNGDEDAPFPV